MIDALAWFFTNIGLAIYNIAYAIIFPATWLEWMGSIGQSFVSDEA